MENKYFNVPGVENLTNKKEKEFRVYSTEKISSNEKTTHQGYTTY